MRRALKQRHVAFASIENLVKQGGDLAPFVGIICPVEKRRNMFMRRLCWRHDVGGAWPCRQRPAQKRRNEISSPPKKAAMYGAWSEHVRRGHVLNEESMLAYRSRAQQKAMRC